MSQSDPHPKSDPPSVPPSVGGKTSHKGGGTSPSRTLAILAYLLPVVGGIIGLAVDGGNPLTRAHARQSIGAALALGLSFVAWAVIGYVISLVPIAGPIVAIALFSFVIAMAVFLAVNWIVSLLLALRGEERTILFANRIAIRLFGVAQPTESSQ